MTVREWRRSGGVKAAAGVGVVVEAVAVAVRGVTGGGQGQGQGSSSAWRGRPHQGGRQRGVVGRDPLNHPLIPLTRGPSAPPAPVLPLCPWRGDGGGSLGGLARVEAAGGGGRSEDRHS